MNLASMVEADADELRATWEGLRRRLGIPGFEKVARPEPKASGPTAGSPLSTNRADTAPREDSDGDD
jgi:hypothetical protein